MKIAIFHNLPAGGALKLLCHTLRSLLTNGHEVVMYSFETADQDFYLLNGPHGIVEKRFPLSMRGLGKWKKYQEASRKIANEINELDFDIVYVEKCRFAGAPHLLQYLTKPSIFFMHEPLRFRENEKAAEGDWELGLAFENEGMSPGLWMKRMIGGWDHFFRLGQDKKSARCAKQILTNSCYSAKWIEKVYGINPHVCYPGIHSNQFQKGLPLGRRPLEVLSVGRLDWHKGYFFLLDALAMIPEKNRPCWTIVCDSQNDYYAKRFKEKAKKLNVSIKILSRISEKELVIMYQNVRLLLCGSIHEPFGLAPLEALACGTPALAVDEGGFRETVIPERTGLLLPRQPQVWADEILKALRSASYWDNSLNQAHTEMNQRWDIKRFYRDFEIQFQKVRLN